MRRLLPGGLTGLAVAVALVIATATGSALAYFTTTGTGSSLAGVSKLTTPAISAATPGIGGTVALTWGAIAPPGSGTVTYSVTRDGGTPAGNCPTSGLPGAVTACTDGGVGVGTHSSVVTARWRSWSAASSTSTAKVTVGAATHFELKAASSSPTAGAGDNLTITALDENNATVTTYSGSHSLVFTGASASPGGTVPTVSNSGGTAVAFGNATAINFAAGVATVNSTKNGVMKLFRSGATTVDASDGSISSSPDLEVAVASAAASKITLGAASTTPTAGTADNLTITVADAYGNPVSSYAGSHSLTFSGATASPGGNAPTVVDSAGTAVAFGSATAIDFIAGVASVDGAANGVMTLYKTGSANLKVSDGSLTSAALSTTTVAATASRFSLSASTATPTAGGTSNLTTTAQDPYGNTATSYIGAHSLTFSGATASPGGNAPTVVDSAGTQVPFGTATALNFSSGVASVASSKNGVMRLYRGGATNVSAGDGTIATSTPLAVTVSTAAAAKLGFSNVSISAGILGSPCLFSCAVTGLGNGGTVKANVLVADTYGNTITAIGSKKAVKISANGGTIAGTPLAINSTGPAETAAQFTYTAPAGGSFSNTITAATSEGTTYASATMTASK